ncbi:MAG: glycosyltransferase family 2 protein [Alphaproteobacteria bacterium]|nr:glycosyltransferase family 2 protein [Alphaproteobacteria bacterium]
MSTVDLSPYAKSPSTGEIEVGVCDYRFPQPVKAGWHLFKLNDTSTATLKPKILFDWGEGPAETSTCPLGPSGPGTYEVLVRIARTATGVQLKGGGSEQSLEYVRLSHTPLGKIGVARHLLSLAARTVLSWPPGRWLFTVISRPQPDGTALRLIHPFRASVLGIGSKKRREEDYARWISAHDYDHTRHADALRAELDALANKPLFSVLMPVYNAPPDVLEKAIQSVADQVYQDWELCIADDCSSAVHVRQTLEKWSARDRRIKLVFREGNGHISAATNTAFQDLATGTWVVMLDHDDELRPNALAELALAVGRAPNAQLIYSDEDKIDLNGNRSEPCFKPQFSIELLRCQNYLNHLTAVRASMVRQVGGWREGFEGSQDYDLYLRVVEQTMPANIVHIPKVLYHWRAVEGSAALGAAQKDYTAPAALRALNEHVARCDLPYEVSRSAGSVFYHTHPKVPEPEPLVSILIPTKDGLDVLRPCIQSILQKTTYANFEIVVIDNNSADSKSHAFFSEISERQNVSVVGYREPFNFSALNNFALHQARGSHVALLNNDLEVISPDWLTHMVSWADQPDIGCVGAKLYYPDDTVQHAGVVLGIGGVAGHGHKRASRAASGYFGHLQVVRNVSAVTAACLVVRKSVYEEAGGLDEENLGVAFNDVDFCLTVRKLGYRNVWTPYAELYHKESHSRGLEDTPEKQERYRKERAHMKAKWGEKLLSDPYYSPNLTLQKEDYSYR